MNVAIFDTRSFEKPLFEELRREREFHFRYFEDSLNEQTVAWAHGSAVVCSSPNDRLDAAVLGRLKTLGVGLVALRSAGFNHVDLGAAAGLGLTVMRVPAYSPHAVAEFATALILALDRKICRASARVRSLDFSLEGLVGFDLHDKVVGIVGTGQIGSVLAKIMAGFGCRILAFDRKPNRDLTTRYGVGYVDLEEIYRRADIISLHIPLSGESQHVVDAAALSKMKAGVMLINTGRGGLIDARALVDALKTGQIGAAGLDVYEEEEGVFAQNLSGGVL
jgi:D-lactate dehydrogenase